MNPLSEKTLNEKDIQDLLTPRERPLPPADLAERIKREIPDDLPAVPGIEVDDFARRRPSRSRVWLMAASVVVAVGGGFLAFRLMDQMPKPGGSAARAGERATDAAPAATEPAAAEEGAAVSEATRGVAEPASTATPGAATSGETTPGETTPDAMSKDRERGDAYEPAARERRPRPTASQAVPGAKNKKEDDAVAPPAPMEPESSMESRMADLDHETVAAERREQLDHRIGELADAGVVLQEQLRRLEKSDSAGDDVGVAPGAGALNEANANPAAAALPPPPRPTASPAPPPHPPAKRIPPPARPRVDTSNASIEYENAQIKPMREEARRLEAELKALEEAPMRRLAPTAPPSTGGTAEPNDAPYGDVFFDSAGTNPFIDTEDDALSTFGLDVDTGSYTVVRRYLEDGHLPPPDAVRVEEFINFFDYGDEPPEEAEFAIHAEGAPSIYGESERYHLLRFNLSGREVDDSDRRPALLTFVVDVSGSMSRGDRLGLVKQALGLLIDQLRADDRLALVIYGSRGQVVLEPTGDHRAIRHAIEQLRTSGSTNAEEGLTLAYELAARHRRRGAINRVILCSDGVANVGATSAGSILDRIRREADQGIELTTVGFGMGNYNDTLMEQLADTGNGRYAYVDTLGEARRVFVENLTGTLQTLAAEARTQVQFDPKTVARYRLLGYENRDIADHRFRDDTVDAGEIGVGHKVTALYEIKLHRELRPSDRVAVLRLRYGSVDGGKMVEVERAVTGADFVRRWEAASPALKLTSLVAEYAEILKRTYWAKEGDLDDVFRRAQKVSARFAGDREVADFVSLVGKAASYRERERR